MPRQHFVCRFIAEFGTNRTSNFIQLNMHACGKCAPRTKYTTTDISQFISFVFWCSSVADGALRFRCDRLICIILQLNVLWARVHSHDSVVQQTKVFLELNERCIAFNRHRNFRMAQILSCSMRQKKNINSKRQTNRTFLSIFTTDRNVHFLFETHRKKKRNHFQMELKSDILFAFVLFCAHITVFSFFCRLSFSLVLWQRNYFIRYANEWQRYDRDFFSVADFFFSSLFSWWMSVYVRVQSATFWRRKKFAYNWYKNVLFFAHLEITNFVLWFFSYELIYRQKEWKYGKKMRHGFIHTKSMEKFVSFPFASLNEHVRLPLMYASNRVRS